MTDPITAPVRLCIVCDRPRDGGRLSCAEAACVAAVVAMPWEATNEIRKREALSAMRAKGAIYFHGNYEMSPARLQERIVELELIGHDSPSKFTPEQFRELSALRRQWIELSQEERAKQ